MVDKRLSIQLTEKEIRTKNNFKSKAASEGKSLKNLLIEVMEKYLAKKL